MAEVDPATFRQLLGRFATGVTVVTATGPDGNPVGMTANTLTSVSLHPPLISVCIDHAADMHQTMQKTVAFTVNILAANQENVTFQNCLNGVRTTVEGGATLANAMRGYPKIFDDLTTNMIEAGETGGILDLILQRLAAYVEKAVKLAASVKSAMIYPVSVIGIAGLVARELVTA